MSFQFNFQKSISSCVLAALASLPYQQQHIHFGEAALHYPPFCFAVHPSRQAWEV
jgi:hypothetical protein